MEIRNILNFIWEIVTNQWKGGLCRLSNKEDLRLVKVVAN
jgi:hypothetical protein